MTAKNKLIKNIEAAIKEVANSKDKDFVKKIKTEGIDYLVFPAKRENKEKSFWGRSLLVDHYVFTLRDAAEEVGEKSPLSKNCSRLLQEGKVGVFVEIDLKIFYDKFKTISEDSGWIVKSQLWEIEPKGWRATINNPKVGDTSIAFLKWAIISAATFRSFDDVLREKDMTPVEVKTLLNLDKKYNKL